jgi:hypothetical protein
VDLNKRGLRQTLLLDTLPFLTDILIINNLEMWHGGFKRFTRFGAWEQCVDRFGVGTDAWHH